MYRYLSGGTLNVYGIGGFSLLTFINKFRFLQLQLETKYLPSLTRFRGFSQDGLTIHFKEVVSDFFPRSQSPLADYEMELRWSITGDYPILDPDYSMIKGDILGTLHIRKKSSRSVLASVRVDI